YLLLCIRNSHMFQLSMNLTSLNGVNKSNFTLGEDKPSAITNISMEEHKVHYKNWERSNRLSLMYM
ncbi:hypothetical protein Lal_00021025, partial [Lupinus albus]